MIGWVLFRADSIGEAFTILRHLVVLDMEWLPPGLGGLLTPRTMVVTAVAAAVVVLPPGFTTGQLLQFGRTPAAAVARVGVCSVGAAYAGLVVASGTFSPFLYYQF
jgi:alginate O-acetyltransferase complex protein AlgI